MITSTENIIATPPPMYEFQKQAVGFHLAHHYSLNCSEMGLGKSRMALEVAKYLGQVPLVFGPAFLAGTWKNEAAVLGMEVQFIPYSMVHKLKFAQVKPFNTWIADECHYLKNPTAQRTHAFYSLIKEALPDYFIGLTGTPIKNRVPDFWTLLAFCGLNPRRTSGQILDGELRKFRAFSRHFCYTELITVRGRKVEKFRGIKDSRLEEFKGLLRDKYIRFRVADVLKDLPTMTRKIVKVDVSTSFDESLRDVFTAYVAGHKTDVTAKMTSATLKAEATAEYALSLLDGGADAVLVFTDHREAAKIIAERMGVHAVVTGATPMRLRQQFVDAFQTRQINVIVATIGSLSVGVTLTAARHVVFNDMSWVPADNLQAEKRIHRIGQPDACFAHYVEATPTDAYIRKTLFEKLETIGKIVG